MFHDLTVAVAGNVKPGDYRTEVIVVTNDSDPRTQRIMVPVEISVTGRKMESRQEPKGTKAAKAGSREENRE